MPTVTKALARTAAATSSATLYTVPASTTTVITNIAVANAVLATTKTIKGFASATTIDFHISGVEIS